MHFKKFTSSSVCEVISHKKFSSGIYPTRKFPIVQYLTQTTSRYLIGGCCDHLTYLSVYIVVWNIFFEKYFVLEKVVLKIFCSWCLPTKTFTKLFSTHHYFCMGVAQLLDCTTARTISGRVIKGELCFAVTILICPFVMQKLESKCMSCVWFV